MIVFIEGSSSDESTGSASENDGNVCALFNFTRKSHDANLMSVFCVGGVFDGGFP